MIEGRCLVSKATLLDLKVVVVSEVSRRNCIFDTLKSRIMEEYRDWRVGALLQEDEPLEF